MAGIRRADWEDIIHETALNAADAWRKYNEANEHKITDEGERNAYEKVFNRLMQEYPYETATMDTMQALYEYKPETVWRWVINGTADPRKEREAIEASKFLPYLVGGTGNGGANWMNTPVKALQEKATEELKYPYTKEGFAQFLRDVGRQQEKFDRAKVLEEMRSMPQYYAAMAAYPSLVEAIDNAVAEGKDISDEEVAKLMALDAGTDIAQVGVPGITPTFSLLNKANRAEKVFSKNPYINTAIAAGLQGGAEAGRQLGKTSIDGDLRRDMSAPAIAASLGATRPGMVGAVQAQASKFQGPTAQNFSRGVMRALKLGDPMDIEKRRLADLVNKYNILLGIEKEGQAEANDAVKTLAAKGLKPVKEWDGTVIVPKNLTESNKNLSAAKIVDIAKALGVEAEKDGSYDADKILSAYGKQIGIVQKIKDGKVVNVDPAAEGLYIYGSDKLYLTPEREQLYRTNLPAKYSYEDSESKARTAGLVLGKVLGDYGTRIEPVVKGNPFGSAFNWNLKDYKKESWYRKLDEEQKKVIDNAMKNKEEEE